MDFLNIANWEAEYHKPKTIVFTKDDFQIQVLDGKQMPRDIEIMRTAVPQLKRKFPKAKVIIRTDLDPMVIHVEKEGQLIIMFGYHDLKKDINVQDFGLDKFPKLEGDVIGEDGKMKPEYKEKVMKKLPDAFTGKSELLNLEFMKQCVGDQDTGEELFEFFILMGDCNCAKMLELSKSLGNGFNITGVDKITDEDLEEEKKKNPYRNKDENGTVHVTTADVVRMIHSF